MTTLRDFGRKAEQALLEKAEPYAEALGERLKDAAEENFKEYASRNGYDIDHIWREATLSVTRRGNEYHIEVQWPGLTAIYEFGVDPFVLEGSPTLSFSWDSPPQGTRPPGAPSYVVADKVNWGSVTGGIEEARAIRGALDFIRFQEQGEITL